MDRVRKPSKAHFFRNHPKPPSCTQNLHDSAPYFSACLHELWEQKSDCGIGLLLKEISFRFLYISGTYVFLLKGKTCFEYRYWAQFSTYKLDRWLEPKRISSNISLFSMKKNKTKGSGDKWSGHLILLVSPRYHSSHPLGKWFFQDL